VQSQETDFDVAVVGGGASGALVATHYREVASFSQRLALVEASGRLCRGAAYGTQLPGHLLNVPASRMSAYANEPDHFAAWLAQHMADAKPDSYAPRMLFGDYLSEHLDKHAPLWPEIVRVGGLVSRITRNDRRWVVHLADSPTCDGGGGDVGTSSNDAEVYFFNGVDYQMYGNDYAPAGSKLLSDNVGLLPASGCSSVELIARDQYLELVQPTSIVVTSPYALRINPPTDTEGTPDALWYVGINRTYGSMLRTGSGVQSLSLCLR